MTDMDLGRRTAARQQRWRRLSRIVSGSLGAAAVGGAVYLGVTGPAVSPVQPGAAEAAAAAAPAQPDDAVATDPDTARGDGGRRGDRGAGFDGGRRR
jgi:hypothetical protein